jgi:hypothetical protein
MKSSERAVFWCASAAISVVLVAIFVEGLRIATMGGHGWETATDQITPYNSADDPSDEAAALKAAEPIDPAMITFREAGSFGVDLRDARALAVAGEGDIYVCGDRALERYSRDGKKLAAIALEGEPRCLAIGSADHAKPGQIYVGMESHVEVYAPSGARVAVWKSPGQNVIFTSMTTIEDAVWVADAGNRVVWRFDLNGNSLRPSPSGFLVTNHYFSLAAGSDDLVYVVNPRLLHVESFTHSGQHETAWGQGSASVKDFFGCCNPAHLAVLPDGRFVTAEKGMPRVKIYARDGTFETIVAGPTQLSATPAGLAADPHGRVLVLDGRPAKVRVFESNAIPKGKTK